MAGQARKGYFIGAQAFLPHPCGERGHWLPTDRCVLFCACPSCGVKAGEFCLGHNDKPVGSTCWVRRQEFQRRRQSVGTMPAAGVVNLANGGVIKIIMREMDTMVEKDTTHNRTRKMLLTQTKARLQLLIDQSQQLVDEAGDAFSAEAARLGELIEVEAERYRELLTSPVE